jgi:hypothetical protein
MAHEEATGMRLARESDGRTAMMAEPRTPFMRL